MNITCIWNGHNTLGEGPLWDHRKGVLYWVDIEASELHCLNPVSKQHQSWNLPSNPGCIGLCDKGGLVAALRKSLVLIELPKGNMTLLASPLENRDDLRFNDGKCDRAGRFWVGTCDVLENVPIGGLYRLNSLGRVDLMDHGFTVSNGIGWSPDNKTMYFTDSPARVIYKYEFDAQHGEISNRQLFVSIAKGAGYPDGLTVDREGFVWSAHWDGFRITRYAPDGHIERVIEMPVQRPTSCCFGGENLTTLFVTSARRDLDEIALAKGPNAGSVFAIETDVTGIPEPLYHLE